jgi:hypothetical protein
MSKATKRWKVQRAREEKAARLAARKCICGEPYLQHRKGICFTGYNMNPEGIKSKCPAFVDAEQHELRKKVQI